MRAYFLLSLILLSLVHLSPQAHAWDAKSWKKPSKEELKKKLTKEQYQVTQEDGTERPFQNKYHDSKAEGIYVDIVSGEPLFSSREKYDSGTGWPSFYKPLVKENIVEKEDRSLFATRTEIRSKHADSHLGHVFDDGPQPTGLRYCMNSASLRFIPKDKMKEEGYEEFLPHFAGDSAQATAIFAGGCFWCMEGPFDKLDGVLSTISGYSGGKSKNPTYKQVSSGTTGHKEVIQITYNPKIISYEKLLHTFWVNVDPYDKEGQFCDKGEQYQSAVYYKNDEEKKVYEKVKAELIAQKKLKEPVATQLIAFKEFYPAEDYHQDYYTKNPVRYNYYRSRCGRDARLKEVWGKSH